MPDKKIYTIDRIEEDVAVLYDGGDNKSDVAVEKLPENIKEGDILIYDEENQTYIIDREKTQEVKSNIEERFKKLFKKW